MAVERIKSTRSSGNGENGITEDNLLPQLEYTFPQRSWAESGVKANLAELDEKGFSLPQALNMLFETSWRPETIVSKNGFRPPLVIYKDVIPTHEDLRQETVLGLLDTLGVGPDELKSLTRIPDFNQAPTFIASMRILENRILPNSHSRLREEIKTRMSQIILDNNRLQSSPFANIVRALDHKLGQSELE